MGERCRDEGEFIPLPSSAVLLFSDAQTTDVYLDLIWIFLDWSLAGVPQTNPLCLGKLERALIVFKVSWQESDAHSHRALSRHRQLQVESQRMPAVSHFFSSDPKCKTDHERPFIGQWLGDLWDSEVLHNDNTVGHVSWTDALEVLKYYQLHLSHTPEPWIHREIKSPSLAESLKKQPADKFIMLMCPCGWSNFKQTALVGEQQDASLDQPGRFPALLLAQLSPHRMEKLSGYLWKKGLCLTHISTTDQ